ncbi:ABC transporter substrate-binding protein [Salipiger sp. IMCC34102]|uniref:ABC transporter substrate-binding protein n=1 Tax=Salipiger sp. IMCC34102 TaxID=2510647 RepID=UPI00101C987C|nr:ABC transporter substrate-binding protein [Salipiger sp. IMCC34102]RYH01682.1 ABC transporter substrate-binding protein [Salipiger sp. IMCC34102]
MKRLLKHLSLVAVLALPVPAAAQDTRTVTDDTGTQVDIPTEPQRIVALHDSVLTVPLLELGAKVAGSHGRGETEDEAFIRSSLSITGMDFDTTDITWVGNNPADIERIAAVAPDLILTTQWQPTDVDQLRAIAPTVVLDYTQRDSWEIYDWLAELTGTTDRLDLMKRRYEEQIALIREVIDTESITVSTIHAMPGELFALNPYGNIGKVLIDAGFQRPALIEAIPEGGRESFTAEVLPEFDGDFIFTTYRSTAGDGPDEVRAHFDSILPGWCEQLHACREDQMYFVSRSLGATRSYYALGAVSYMLLSVIGGQDFTPIAR